MLVGIPNTAQACLTNTAVGFFYCLSYLLIGEAEEPKPHCHLHFSNVWCSGPDIVTTDISLDPLSGATSTLVLHLDSTSVKWGVLV